MAEVSLGSLIVPCHEAFNSGEIGAVMVVPFKIDSDHRVKFFSVWTSCEMVK